MPEQQVIKEITERIVEKQPIVVDFAPVISAIKEYSDEIKSLFTDLDNSISELKDTIQELNDDDKGDTSIQAISDTVDNILATVTELPSTSMVTEIQNSINDIQPASTSSDSNQTMDLSEITTQLNTLHDEIKNQDIVAQVEAITSIIASQEDKNQTPYPKEIKTTLDDISTNIDALVSEKDEIETPSPILLALMNTMIETRDIVKNASSADILVAITALNSKLLGLETYVSDNNKTLNTIKDIL